MGTHLFEIKNLVLDFESKFATKRILKNINFYLNEGEILAIVGQSGSGKTVTLHTIMGLLPPTAKIVSGEILYKDQQLINLSKKDMNKIRGKEIGMIFQDATNHLNPTMKVGKQIADIMVRHLGISWKVARIKTLKILNSYQFENAEIIYNKYPHELSGGQCQRIMLAMVTACKPKIILADEPTSALDFDNQNTIIMELEKTRVEDKSSIIVVTHDINVAKRFADRIAIFHNGMVVETGTVRQVIGSPIHPYTKHLISAIPDNKTIKKGPINIKASRFFETNNWGNALPGCKYSKICDRYNEKCNKNPPNISNLKVEHQAVCWESLIISK